MNNQGERSNTLDIAKGITIILMVIGHCYSTNNCILTLIYGYVLFYVGYPLQMKKLRKR